MRTIGLALISALLLLLPAPAHGQVAWDAPLLVSPGSPAGWSLNLTDPWPGSGIGALATWRGYGPLGFRIGLAEGPSDAVSVYGGIDASGAIARHSASFPFDVDWVTGAGIGVGEATLVSFPLGLSLGRRLHADGVTFIPSVTPRVVLDAWFGDDRPRSGADLELAVDLGMDIAFQPSWMIRFGATLGDRSALSIGLGFPLSGR